MPSSQIYGLWSSPINPFMLGNRLRLEDVQWDTDGQSLIWLESRSGKGCIVRKAPGDARQDLTDEHNVHGGIGYGGGEFTLHQDLLVFSDRSGRLFRRRIRADRPSAVTPAFGNAASPAISPDGQWIAYIYSDGQTDLVGLVDSQGIEWPLKLIQGADFYMQPTWHPAGDRLAWVEWNHPNMPWDGARLKIGKLSGTPPHLDNIETIAGSDTQAASQPRFSPDGRWLSYIQSAGEWEELVLLDLNSGERRILVNSEGFDLSLPAWIQGMRSYGWSFTSQTIFYTRYSGGTSTLWQVSLSTGISTEIDIRPYSWITQLTVSPRREALAFLGSAPSIPNRVIFWDAAGLHTIARSEPESVPTEYYSTPKEISWFARDGVAVHGLYYPPTNPLARGNGLPPAILHIHGGPTSVAAVGYEPTTAYFTSRGYAWLEVNYRGSTGYGRTYRDALRQRWGDVDVEDAVGGAQALINQQLAYPGRIVIMGGSAGGYTVLNALIRFPGTFKAGICSYGVSNLFTLDLDTHKFEAHYNASLIGKLPEAAQRYHDWSPAFHASQIRDPLAIFQGSEDKVVPPAQSEEIVKALQQNKIPHLYRLYEGEGHGFRQSATIMDYLQQTERFLLTNVLFSA